MQRDGTEYRHDRASLSSIRRVVAAVSRYDLVLAMIPLSFAGATVWAALADIDPTTAITVAGVCCLLALADALFVNPPGRGGRGGPGGRGGRDGPNRSGPGRRGAGR